MDDLNYLDSLIYIMKIKMFHVKDAELNPTSRCLRWFSIKKAELSAKELGF